MKERILVVLLTAFLLLAIQNRYFNYTIAPTKIAAEIHTSTTSPFIVSNILPFVTRVIDGDTLEVRIDNNIEKVRLIGVDTPETVDPRKPVQCFGKEASAFTKNLVENKTVRLESDASQSHRDMYGRLLLYVFLEDGTFLNEKLISEGYGHEYTYRVPYKYQSEFKDVENQAKKEGQGLWAKGACS